MTEDISQPLFQMGEQREKSFDFICCNVTLQMPLLAFPTHQTFTLLRIEMLKRQQLEFGDSRSCDVLFDNMPSCPLRPLNSPQTCGRTHLGSLNSVLSR